MRPRFTLMLACTADGFIAREPGHTPEGWASPEEQALFLSAVDGTDWSIMGRVTAEAAPKPWRRRVVFSTGAPRPEWRLPTQVWLDPNATTPDALPAHVGAVRPMREALVLGGTRVHDWFLAHGRIDAVTMTIEPVRFGEGLPIFGDQAERDPVETFVARGFAVVGTCPVNDRGTVIARLLPR